MKLSIPTAIVVSAFVLGWVALGIAHVTPPPWMTATAGALSTIIAGAFAQLLTGKPPPPPPGAS